MTLHTYAHDYTIQSEPTFPSVPQDVLATPMCLLQQRLMQYLATTKLGPRGTVHIRHLCKREQHRTATSIYIFENVCLFVCLFAVNAKTTERIDAKRSGITKNYPESVLCGLKSPVLALSGRYSDISGFSLAADRHFYLSSFHFRLLLRRLTQSASQTQQNYGTN